MASGAAKEDGMTVDMSDCENKSREQVWDNSS